MPNNFCPKCGKRIKIRENLCENCLIAEYQKRIKGRSLGRRKLTKNKTMENEETQNEPTPSEEIEEKEEEAVE